MKTKEIIEEFLAQKNIAIFGISRNPHKFGNAISKELKAKGYNIYPINPNSQFINDEVCYPDLRSLPVKVDGVIIVTKPIATEMILKDVVENGIKRVWMQQGAGSHKSIQYCLENDIQFVNNKCILMYAQPVKSVHNFHRWIWGLIRKLY